MQARIRPAGNISSHDSSRSSTSEEPKPSGAGSAAGGRRQGSVDMNATSPAQEVYGFVLYLASFILYVAYLLWAFIPDSVFERVGITYLPSKYWAVVWPVWSLLLIVFIWAYFLAIHLLRTPSFDSFNTITDEYANVAPGLDYARTGHSTDHIPELQDIPITIVNACLYNTAPEDMARGRMGEVSALAFGGRVPTIRTSLQSTSTTTSHLQSPRHQAPLWARRGMGGRREDGGLNGSPAPDSPF